MIFYCLLLLFKQFKRILEQKNSQIALQYKEEGSILNLPLKVKILCISENLGLKSQFYHKYQHKYY